MALARITIDSVVILTELCCYNGDVMLGDGLSVKKFVCGNGSLHRIDVEVVVQVALPVDGIPGRKCLGTCLISAIIKPEDSPSEFMDMS